MFMWLLCCTPAGVFVAPWKTHVIFRVLWWNNLMWFYSTWSLSASLMETRTTVFCFKSLRRINILPYPGASINPFDSLFLLEQHKYKSLQSSFIWHFCILCSFCFTHMCFMLWLYRERKKKGGGGTDVHTKWCLTSLKNTKIKMWGLRIVLEPITPFENVSYHSCRAWNPYFFNISILQRAVYSSSVSPSYEPSQFSRWV